MDWFLYDNGLRHERVDATSYCEHQLFIFHIRKTYDSSLHFTCNGSSDKSSVKVGFHISNKIRATKHILFDDFET